VAFSHFRFKIIKFNGFWNFTNYVMDVSLEINLFKLVCFQVLLGWAELGDRPGSSQSQSKNDNLGNLCLLC
jgi:hypothetical protein